MNYEQELINKRQGGDVGRADTDGQFKKARALVALGFDDTTCLLTLERQFFLARKQSNAVLNVVRMEQELAVAANNAHQENGLITE